MGASIVLLHGGFGRPEVWQQVTGLLDGGGFHLVTPTGPNWGERRDEPLRAYTAAEMAQDLAGQVDAAGQAVHLVGYSMGGVLALELAVMRHWPLASLTLVEASPTPLLRLTEHGAEADGHGAACAAFAAAVAAGEPDVARRVFEANNEPGYWDSLPDPTKATLDRFAPAAARDAMMEAQRHYRAEELAQLDVPTVVAYGSGTIPRLRHISEALARFIPGAELVPIPGADHDVLRTHPAAVAEVILRAVRRREQASR